MAGGGGMQFQIIEVLPSNIASGMRMQRWINVSRCALEAVTTNASRWRQKGVQAGDL